MDEGLSIGELAGRAGVTVRALRLYEAAGLLKPLRASAYGHGVGRRVYGAGEVARLGQIMALKRAGFTLKRIGELVGGRTAFDPLRLVEAQISALQDQARSVERGLKGLRAAQAQLQRGQSLDVSALCELIRRGDEIMNHEAWAKVFERYYTPQDLANWEKTRDHFTPEDTDGYGARWRALIGCVEAAMARGVAPDAPEGMALAEDWYALQRPMVEAVGVETWNKAAVMHQEMESWRSPQAEPPFSKAVYDYACQATEAARAAGLVPPRVAT